MELQLVSKKLLERIFARVVGDPGTRKYGGTCFNLFAQRIHSHMYKIEAVAKMNTEFFSTLSVDN